MGTVAPEAGPTGRQVRHSGAQASAPLCFGLRPHRNVKKTRWVVSHFRPPAIHHGDRHLSGCGTTSRGLAVRPAVAGRAETAGLGATPQSEGLLRVRRQVCLHTPAPDPGVAPTRAIPGGKAVQPRFRSLGCVPSAESAASGDATERSERCSCQRTRRRREGITHYPSDFFAVDAGLSTLRRKPGPPRAAP